MAQLIPTTTPNKNGMRYPQVAKAPKEKGPRHEARTSPRVAFVKTNACPIPDVIALHVQNFLQHNTKKVPQTAARLGIRMRYLFVSDLENDSLNLFQPTAEAIGQYMPIIFVANIGRNTTDLEFFESYHVRLIAHNIVVCFLLMANG